MSTVLGFNGIPKYPIIAAVIIIGIKLGINEMMIIRAFANNNPMVIAMSPKASNKLPLRLAIRNLFPFINKGVVPVILAVISVPANKLSILGLITWFTSESILSDPTSATCMEIRMVCIVESTKELNNPELSDCPLM